LRSATVAVLVIVANQRDHGLITIDREFPEHLARRDRSRASHLIPQEDHKALIRSHDF
jgi:hypothetical protein